MTDPTPTQAAALKVLYEAHRSAQNEARSFEAVAFLSIVELDDYAAGDTLVRQGYAMRSGVRYWITVLGRFVAQEGA